MVDAVAFTNCVRFKLLMKQQAISPYNQQLGLKRERHKNILQENIGKLIKGAFKNIQISGFLTNSSPTATQLTRLLNISQTFKKCGRLDQASQSDILVALSLINARRFIQAAELLKKVSKYFVDKYISNKSGMELSRIQRSWMRQCQSKGDIEIASLGRSYGAGRVLEGGKILVKAAKVELLLAQSINHPSLINEKLQAYSRANNYYLGNANPIPLPMNSDLQEITLSIGPQIIPFLSKMLYQKSEPVRISALKSIKFLFETLGCTLANSICQILKSIVGSYPITQKTSLNLSQCPIGITLSQYQQFTTTSRNKLLIDYYHHVLQTILTILPQISKKILKSIFSELVLPNIIQHQIAIQLKLYFLRFSQKIIFQCLADLQITIQFLVIILNLSDSKNTNLQKDIQNKHVLYNLTYFAQKNFQLIKTKIFIKYDNNKVIPICLWISQALSYLCENQMTSLTNSSNIFYFNQMLELSIIIYSRKFRCKVVYPIQPILYFLNMSIHQQWLPFDKILQILVILIKKISSINPTNQISEQIIERIMDKSKLSNLNLKQMKILAHVIQLLENIQISWLQMFLNCIPHSTYDQAYTVLNIFLEKSKFKLNKNLIVNIVETLLDQYTVKGKAHQQSKQKFIQIILQDQNKDYLLYMFQICLFDNNEPNSQNYYARKKRNNEHIFDSKMFRIHSEMFTQKLSLIQLMINRIQQQPTLAKTILSNQQIVCLIHRSLFKLVSSYNSKLKNKAINIIKFLINIFQDKNNIITQINLLFSKAILSLLKTCLSNNRDSKFQYNVIHTLDLLFEKIFKANVTYSKDEQSIEQTKLSFMDGNVQCWGKDVQHAYLASDYFYLNLRLREVIKLWSLLIGLYNSPWESVKQAVIIFLCKFFILDLSNYRISLQYKILDLTRPLLKSFLNSSQHTERLRGVKMIACMLGMGRVYRDKNQVSQIIKINSKFFKELFAIIFQLQDDWDQTVSQISQNISELCLSNETQDTLRRRILIQKRTMGNYPENSFCTFNLGQQFIFQRKFQGSFSTNNFNDNMDNFLKESCHFDTEEEVYLKLQQNKNQENQTIEVTQKIWEKLGQFRCYLEKNNIFAPENIDRDSFAEQDNDHFFQAGEDKPQSNQGKDSKSEEEHLEFQDLGIIQLDDQEWGEEENQVKITQKLPLKKIYKLSPSVGGTSKPQRIRSKRYHQSQIDQHENIIVDQLQGRIQQNNKINQYQKFQSQRQTNQIQIDKPTIEINFNKSKDLNKQIMRQTQKQKDKQQPSNGIQKKSRKSSRKRKQSINKQK